MQAVGAPDVPQLQPFKHPILMKHVYCAVELETSLEGPGRSAGAAHEGTPAQQSRNKSQHSSTAPLAATAEDVFNWSQAWYPLAAVSALKTDAPTAHQLLGMRVVVWWDKVSESWRCFEDLCPHR